MKKVLIAEDSQIVAKILMHIARQELSFDIVLATTFEQAKQLCDQHQDDIFAAIVDLNLPDAPNGEVVDYTLGNSIPTIVLTGSLDSQRREKLLSKGIVDYVAKEGRFSYQYAVHMVDRLYKNKSIKVMVVEDSKTTRNHVKSLLKRQQFQVLEAVDGIDAIKVLLDNPDIRLLITDYNMPHMDGFELVKNIRCKYEKFDLIIIGLSAATDESISARFIKKGTNDFLTKPFNPEEFYCRVNHNIESLDLIEKIRDSANRDYLTELYSRRYFFEKGEELHDQALASQQDLALALIDIDDFKKINDEYGPSNGDVILHQFSKTLDEALTRFLVARSSSNEFYILMPGLSNHQALALIDKVRSLIASKNFSISHGGDLYLSFSAGITNILSSRIYDQIDQAEHYLIRAKQAGKNIVIGDDDIEEEE